MSVWGAWLEDLAVTRALLVVARVTRLPPSLPPSRPASLLAHPHPPPPQTSCRALHQLSWSGSSRTVCLLCVCLSGSQRGGGLCLFCVSLSVSVWKLEGGLFLLSVCLEVRGRAISSLCVCFFRSWCEDLDIFVAYLSRWLSGSLDAFYDLKEPSVRPGGGAIWHKDSATPGVGGSW